MDIKRRKDRGEGQGSNHREIVCAQRRAHMYPSDVCTLDWERRPGLGLRTLGREPTHAPQVE